MRLACSAWLGAVDRQVARCEAVERDTGLVVSRVDATLDALLWSRGVGAIEPGVAVLSHSLTYTALYRTWNKGYTAPHVSPGICFLYTRVCYTENYWEKQNWLGHGGTSKFLFKVKQFSSFWCILHALHCIAIKFMTLLVHIWSTIYSTGWNEYHIHQYLKKIHHYINWTHLTIHCINTSINLFIFIL